MQCDVGFVNNRRPSFIRLALNFIWKLLDENKSKKNQQQHQQPKTQRKAPSSNERNNTRCNGECTSRNWVCLVGKSQSYFSRYISFRFIFRLLKQYLCKMNMNITGTHSPVFVEQPTRLVCTNGNPTDFQGESKAHSRHGFDNRMQSGFSEPVESNSGQFCSLSHFRLEWMKAPCFARWLQLCGSTLGSLFSGNFVYSPIFARHKQLQNQISLRKKEQKSKQKIGVKLHLATIWRHWMGHGHSQTLL